MEKSQLEDALTCLVRAAGALLSAAERCWAHTVCFVPLVSSGTTQSKGSHSTLAHRRPDFGAGNSLASWPAQTLIIFA